MMTLDGNLVLAQRHRETVQAAALAAASALAFAKLRRLRGATPAQPMPPGAYECWSTSSGLSIVRIGAAGASGEREVCQVWPPAQPGRDSSPA